MREARRVVYAAGIAAANAYNFVAAATCNAAAAAAYDDAATYTSVDPAATYAASAAACAAIAAYVDVAHADVVSAFVAARSRMHLRCASAVRKRIPWCEVRAALPP